LDSFATLGFLQSLEKKGLQVEIVAGTGFACWIAKNWADYNKGSNAEWQSFKFDSWKGIESTLWDRVSSQNALRRFENYIQKISSTQRRSTQSAIIWTCPLFYQPAHSLPSIQTRTEMNFSNNLLKQLELEALDFGPFPFERDFSSGSFADYPIDKWLESLDQLWDQKKFDDRAWLILDTRYLFAQWSRSQNTTDIGFTPQQVRWVHWSVGKKNISDLNSIKNFDRRREFLLQGRKSADEFFEQSRYRQFLGWSSDGESRTNN
jgi:predicted acylesterase/phospholipase RssA